MPYLYLLCMVVAVYGIQIQSPVNKSTTESATIPLFKNESLLVTESRNLTLAPFTSITTLPPEKDLITSTTAPTSAPASTTAPTSSAAPAPSGAEATDMRNSTYRGGTDVDEIGPNNKIEHSVREDSKHLHDSSSSKGNDTEASKMMAPEPPGMSPATATAVVISVCIGMVLVGYSVMLVWRILRMKKQNQRELLVNEDDTDITEEDLRHFEAACIQLEPEV